MFVTRTVSGVILLAVTIAMIAASGPLLYLFITAISVIGLFELYRVFNLEKSYASIVGYLSAVAMSSVILAGKGEGAPLVLTVGFLAVMTMYVLTYPRYHADQIVKIIFGMVYVPFMLCYIFRTRVEADGAYTVWLIFISAWGCDTCAYLAGRAFGKHKMTPVLSPRKTVEGAVGGVAGAGILGLIYGLIFAEKLTAFTHPALSCVIICVCGAFLSMMGDLSASAIKRNYDIKDYGKIIPGHGGIMDRFDSVIFTAPCIYILTVILQAV